MEDDKALLLMGYRFELTEYICAEGLTTISVRVSGNGEHPCDLSGWVIELCPGNAQKLAEEICIVSCEKRRRGGSWLPACAQKTSYELTGDISLSGVLIDEWVGRYAEDAPTEFRVTLDTELEPEPMRVAFIAGEVVYESTECLHARWNGDTAPIWNTPVEKPFCLYLVVPEGYIPQSACRANISITRRGLFLAHEQSGSDTSVRTVLHGAVKVVASVPLKSREACGDAVEVSACDCFELCETLGYAKENTQLSDVAVCPKKSSFDLTLLSAHCGKSVYRLDGTIMIDCRREET